MIMFEFVYFVLYLSWFMFTNCSEEQIVSWPSSPSGVRNISNMILIRDGQVLLISGLNHLYTLNTTSFQLIRDVVTGPLDGTDIVMRLVLYNKTEQDTVGYITTCSSLHSYCDIREESNIWNVVDRLEEPIKSDGVQAFMTFYQRPGGIHQLNKFLFIACPHAEVQENRCEKPGIIWYLISGNDKPDPWFGFKSYHDTPILTEKYVDAFTVDKYRIFFSIQYDKHTRKRESRIAQMCQNYGENHYTTSLTYADMPIQCGRLKEIQAVRKIMFGTETVFIALFSDSVTSSVCVYSMVETRQRFVDNIKDCYSGRRVSDGKDYINFKSQTIPCKSVYKADYSSRSNDNFLCNEDNLNDWHQVVGTQLLSKEPAVKYDMSLTALTVTVVGSKIIAFLGTTYGDILKAVVYPSNSTNYVQQPIIPNIGDFVKKDMFTSSDGQHIFALSDRKVFKIPVQSCSGFSTCSECLGNNDPYCGWCFLEERCGTKDACQNMKWISASRDDKCPSITAITPTVMSVNELKLLEMRVSHELLDVSVSCLIHSEEVGSDFDQIQRAEVSEDKLTVQCTPTNEFANKNKMQGYLNVMVTILVNNSATTIQGHFDIFQCEKFERCINCTAERWRCKWCAYTNKCKNDDASCDYHSIRPGEGCPRITNYSVVKGGDDDVQDMTGSVYLSRGRNYKINITGTNLMTPKTTPNSIMYKCKVVVSGTQVLWFNRTHFNNGSLMCNLEKEEMSKITSLENEVDAKVQVTWGDYPIYGDTMPVNVYACEGLPKPTDNCGHCKSFAISKPYYNCKWCMTKCVDSTEMCHSSACGRPRIIKVFPLSAHVNATTLITVTGVNLGFVYNDTIDSVTVAGIPCASVESGYDPGLKIECILPPSYKVMHGSVIVTMNDNTRGNFSSLFHFRVPQVTSITPFLGPLSGGTIVTILGELLDTGRNFSVSIGGKPCRVNTYEEGRRSPTKLVCTTTAGNQNEQDKHLYVIVEFDGAFADVVENVNYSYVQDPNITSISPKTSFKSGGRTLTIKGDNLYSIQKPKIYAVVDNKRLKSEDCIRDDSIGVIYCHSPRYTEMGSRKRKRSGRTSRAMIGFEMDDVSSVKAENLPSGISVLFYFDDPFVENFTEDKVFTEYLSVKGERFKDAADENDVVIKIGCEKCNVTKMTDDVIICQPPIEEPKCSHLVKNHKLTVKVNIGFLKRNVGSIIYDDNKQQDGPGRKTEEYIIAGSIVGSLLLCLIIFTAIICVMWRKNKLMKEEKISLEYKIDKLEAKFGN